jgi:DNA processing protein
MHGSSTGSVKAWHSLPRPHVRPPGYPDYMTSAHDEQAALLALLRLRPQALRWPELTQHVLEHGSAVAALLNLTGDQLFLTADQRAELDTAAKDLEGWRAEGLIFSTVLDHDYPARLRDIHQVPPFVFARGDLRTDDVAVSVVGSRDATEQGVKMATSVAQALVGEGISVISGLATGIDTAAHQATLEAGGRPVGIIGTGIRLQYPAANRGLHRQVAERGLLLSQFWPDAPPQKHTFPMRNATMSGYGVATVVIQAGEHSGARIQARMAVEHGRPVILTDLVLNSTAWAKELRDRPGVQIATSTQDVVDVIRGLRALDQDIASTLHALSAL